MDKVIISKIGIYAVWCNEPDPNNYKAGFLVKHASNLFNLACFLGRTLQLFNPGYVK